jgi:hypothetical protein
VIDPIIGEWPLTVKRAFKKITLHIADFLAKVLNFS